MSEAKKREVVQPEKLELESMDIANDRREKLRAEFPEVFLEGGKVDFDQLRRTLGRLLMKARSDSACLGLVEPTAIEPFKNRAPER